MKRPCPKYAHKLFVVIVYWFIWSTAVILLGPSSVMAAPPTDAPLPPRHDSSLDLPLDQPPPDSASAQEPRMRETTLFEEIPSVYGAAKYDQKVNEAPAAVTIITAEQIRKYGYRNFAQILDSVPGLFTSNDRNYGYLGIRGFNRPGDYTSRVLLLIDNHRLNDAVFDQGGAGTETPIDVDLIDRVEIIKGPGSSLYGTECLIRGRERDYKTGKGSQGRRGVWRSLELQYLSRPSQLRQQILERPRNTPIRLVLQQRGTPGVVLSGIRFYE